MIEPTTDLLRPARGASFEVALRSPPRRGSHKPVPRATPGEPETPGTPALKGRNRSPSQAGLSVVLGRRLRSRIVPCGALSGLGRWGGFLSSQGGALGWIVSAPSGQNPKT